MVNITCQNAAHEYRRPVEICGQCKKAGEILSEDLMCLECEIENRFRLVVNGKWAGRYKSVEDATKRAFIIAGQIACRAINIYPVQIDFRQYLAKNDTITSTQLIGYGMSRVAASTTIKKAAEDGLIKPCGFADVLTYRSKDGRLVPCLVKNKVIRYRLANNEEN